MGYKHELFSKKLDQNLQCSICHEIFKEPMSCSAGHTFCRECIHRWLQSNKRCPADNTYLDKKSLVPNLTVKGIIDDLDVYCHPVSIENTKLSPANKRIRLESSTDDEGDEENCCWIGKLHELATHRKTCGFQLTTCTHENCKQQMKRKEFEKHKETCKYKRVACKECTSFVVECKLQEHLENDCPKAMVPCENNCSTDGAVTKIRRMDLEEHLINVCVKAIVSCPFEEHGCLAQFERQDVDKHVQYNMAAHILLLGKKCSALTKENHLLSDKLNHVQEEFHNQLLSICSYTWVVGDYPKLAKLNPNGSRIDSPPFWMRGYKWSINLYPNGRNVEAMGFLSLYLKRVEEDSQPRSQSLSNNMPNTSNNESATPYRLTVISQMPEGHDVYFESKRVFTKNKGAIGGWSKFMKSSDVISRCYVKDNRLIIKCTTHYPDKPQ